MAPKLLKDGTVISFDIETKSIRVLRRASVLIVDDRIAAVEEDSDAITVPDGTEIIDVSGKIVSPGFVNAHVHMWQSAYRTLGPNVTLSQYFDWMSQSSPGAQAAFRADDIYFSSLEGYLEGINGGVTSYVEHAHNNWSPEVMRAGHRAAVHSGARIWWCYDVADHDHFPIAQQWTAFGDLAKYDFPLVLPGLSLDGQGFTLLNGDGAARAIVREKEVLGLQALTVHHLGGPWPRTFLPDQLGILNSYLTDGNTSPSALCDMNELNDVDLPIIVSHAPFLSKSDMETMRRDNVFVAIAPESECHYGHGQATGHEISDQACLGVDTTWTFSGDMLSQARLWLQLTRLRNYTKTLDTGLLPNANPMPVEEAFLLATRQGGRALWRDDIGVIAVGAKADVVVFNGDSPNMLGWSDPIAAVVLHANPGDIEHVIVDGEWKKRNFKLVNLARRWDEVRTRFLEISKRIQEQLKTPPPLPDRLWGVGQFGDVEKVSTKL
ncbi:hypothetical protein ASPSYDRAFT_90616 [Aspergillus sydowii CBS 593.65]|uniref:Amidohydrolase-related domain-containing protein n=1 Tax=Aspergillus sydowii CBS 593.65 TaxID=1036612 RepID=A0A1L9TD14_9EURO|nr:uncharacterized protein ASPSYDRAFT_90616 [Aspergillus sydowii CBS 593.65]OJJ57320.1 hypothetical protein ASPSYDRAFT_90616 [Aspergillus sydowii CBS 593.65]